MSEFGQVINPHYDPSKNHVYEAFYTYFENPTLTKIKNVEVYTVYMATIHCMLGNGKRYLILFVERDFNVTGTEKNMKDLEWISLQTRTLDDHHNLKAQTYQVRKTPELSNKITLKTQNEDETTYDVDRYPLTVTLLHTRKNNSYQYQPTGTIVSALETYQTIVNFTK